MTSTLLCLNVVFIVKFKNCFPCILAPSDECDVSVCVIVCNSVPPEFSDEQPDQVKVTEDETAELPVKVSANPDEITCEWIFQGEKLVKGSRQHYMTFRTMSSSQAL